MSTGSVQQRPHIVPLRVYLGVAAALCVLTAVTVSVSFIHLGGWNVVVALAVAATKATLVALIFMHLLYDKKLFLIIFLVAVMFLAIFIIFTMFDTLHRDVIDEIQAQPIRENAAMYDSLQAKSRLPGEEHEAPGAKPPDSTGSADNGSNRQ